MFEVYMIVYCIIAMFGLVTTPYTALCLIAPLFWPVVAGLLAIYLAYITAMALCLNAVVVTYIMLDKIKAARVGKKDE